MDVGSADLAWSIDRPTYMDVGSADLAWSIDRPTYKEEELSRGIVCCDHLAEAIVTCHCLDTDSLKLGIVAQACPYRIQIERGE